MIKPANEMYRLSREFKGEIDHSYSYLSKIRREILRAASRGQVCTVVYFEALSDSLLNLIIIPILTDAGYSVVMDKIDIPDEVALHIEWI
jgi:hypothetical protein